MLRINYNDTDLSIKLEEFTKPGIDIALMSSQFLWIGYYKPINNLHIEFMEEVTSSSTLSITYETAAGFVPVDSVVDHTNGLGNSGKIAWEVGTTAQIASLRFGVIAFWYKVSVDITTASMNYLGINVLFSNDSDLEEEYPGIKNNLPTGQNSFVNFHASARKDIVQSLRKKFDLNKKLLTQYDLLNNEEVKQASKYLALSKILDWLSDAPKDRWSEKSEFYYNKHVDYLMGVEISVDTNDNGVSDEGEKSLIQYIQVECV